MRRDEALAGHRREPLMRWRAWLRVLVAAGIVLALSSGAIALHRLRAAGYFRASDAQQVSEGLASLGMANGAGSPPEDAVDVVVIVLDTVRRDHVSVYGYPDTTPNLARWSESARVFTRARSVASWTLPAHASLFTGRRPIGHGTHTGAPDSGHDFYSLPEGTPTLASALRERGYRTVGIAANRGFLSTPTGVSQGFDLWLCEGLRRDWFLPEYADASRITDMALQVLGAPRDEPLFLFLNYMDAHTPIQVREDYVRRPDRVRDALLPDTPEFDRQTRALMARGTAVSPALVESWVRGYDGELRYLDEHLGRLLTALPRLGIDDDDLVVVLSDHGESFGDHDLVLHWKSLYEEIVAIPLIVRGPGFAAGRDDRYVQTQDVPRWIVDALEVPRLPEMSITEDVQISELYWTRHGLLRMEDLRPRFDRVLRSFVWNENKLLLGDDGSREWFELRDDPDEAHPLDGPDWAAPLMARAEQWLARHAVAEGHAVEFSEEMANALKSLGYMDDADDETRDLPRDDPSGT